MQIRQLQVIFTTVDGTFSHTDKQPAAGVAGGW
jgi:hypothetical protein